MAIINTYPSAAPKGADLLIGTQVKDDTIPENSTKSFSVSAIGSFLITSNNIITGSGTLRKIPMFTPNGQAIGDSIMFQKPNDLEIQVGVYGLGSETTLGAGYISTTGLGVTNISASEGGEVTLSGNVVIGDGLGLPDYLTISSSVQDSNAAVGTEGQILVADSSSRLLWQSLSSISEIKSKKVIVSTAELRNLHTTPKILVDVTAGNPKEICQVYSVVFGVGGNNSSDNLVFPNDINIESDSPSPWKYVIPQSIANEQGVIAPYYNPSLTAGRIGLDSDVILSSAGAAVETGTATTTMTVWITYRIFNIAD